MNFCQTMFRWAKWLTKRCLLTGKVRVDPHQVKTVAHQNLKTNRKRRRRRTEKTRTNCVSVIVWEKTLRRVRVRQLCDTPTARVKVKPSVKTLRSSISPLGWGVSIFMCVDTSGGLSTLIVICDVYYCT